ncbi:MAG: hypothetical protein WD802_00680 [Gemmatimonadaceae bacterium]
MKHRNRGRVAGLSFIVAVVACADGVERIAAPSASTQGVADGGQDATVAERAALSKIGRLVAISLADRELRHRLKKDLRAAPFKEHKLELGRYLRSADGQQLLRRMGTTGDRSADAILTTLDQVRSLELYMPVRKHREEWVGDGELLVATQLEEDDAIVAFNGRGQEIRLDASTEPTQPTISIVASETRFDQPMPIGSKNIEDRNGQAIGTLMPPSFQPSGRDIVRVVRRWWRRRQWWQLEPWRTAAGRAAWIVSRVLADSRYPRAVDPRESGDRGSHSWSDRPGEATGRRRSIVLGRGDL